MGTDLTESCRPERERGEVCEGVRCEGDSLVSRSSDWFVRFLQSICTPICIRYTLTHTHQIHTHTHTHTLTEAIYALVYSSEGPGPNDLNLLELFSIS